MSNSFLRFLNENPNSRKIFGERELKIIEKQLNGVNLTQSEKNRLSRDIRQKLNFIEKFAVYKEDFSLKKNQANLDLIKESIEEIKKGDYVIVDNPHWKAALGNDKPVRRKVKMVLDEVVVFNDGSTSSLKYIKKMEDGGVISKTHKID